MASAGQALDWMLEGKWVTAAPARGDAITLRGDRIVRRDGSSAGRVFFAHLRRTDWVEWASSEMPWSEALVALKAGRTVRHPGMAEGVALRRTAGGTIVRARDGVADTLPYQLDLDDLERTDWTEYVLTPPPPEP